MGTAVLTLLCFAGAFLYVADAEAPRFLFSRRLERQFCIQCGSHALLRVSSVVDVDSDGKSHPELLSSPKLDGIDPEHCKHRFLFIAGDERYLDLKRLRWEHWKYGSMDGEPLYSSPALIKAFMSLSSTNSQDARELFMFLSSMQARKVNRDKIEAEAKNGTPASVMEAIQQAFKSKGLMLPSEREKAKASRLDHSVKNSPVDDQ